jgi:SAM-dependent methyltransferase
LQNYLVKIISRYKIEHKITNNGVIRILDWGCGRGKSVIKLLNEGYDAYGVEIDENTMSKGFDLLESRGLNPKDRLRLVSETNSFEDNWFDIVFSEQVVEHVEDIDQMISEIARITKKGGVGVHVYPGSRSIVEVHLHMPWVHWLPKNKLRYWYLILAVQRGQCPLWPEAEGKTVAEKALVFYNYLNQKTHYRDVRELVRILGNYGLSASYSTNRKKGRYWIPGPLKRNGFPRGLVFLESLKM